MATRVLHERDECDTGKKKIDFDKDTSENLIWNPYISYMAIKKLQVHEDFHSKNYLLEMPRSHGEMHLKSTTNWTL